MSQKKTLQWTLFVVPLFLVWAIASSSPILSIAAEDPNEDLSSVDGDVDVSSKDSKSSKEDANDEDAFGLNDEFESDPLDEVAEDKSGKSGEKEKSRSEKIADKEEEPVTEVDAEAGKKGKGKARGLSSKAENPEVSGTDWEDSESLPGRSVDDGAPNQLTNMEFKMVDGVSKIILTARKPVIPELSKGVGDKQVVILLQNTEVQDKLQRAYDTSEFRSPVSLFTLFQLPRAERPTGKLIIQLREAVTPKVVESSRGLIIEFPSGSQDDVEVVIGDKKDEILSGDNIYGRNQQFRGQMIERLEIKNSEVQDVLRLIARTSGYNVVIGDDVSGTVGTLSLENVPWDQVFTLVLQSKKLGYVREGNVLRIATTTSLKSEKEEAVKIEEASRRAEPLKTILLPVSYAKADDLMAKAKDLLSERGTAQTDSRTNTLIIKDIESSIERIQKLIAALDTQPPRVFINGRVMEVKNDFSRKLGVSALNQTIPFSQGVQLDHNFGSTIGGSSVIKLGDGVSTNPWVKFELAELDTDARTLASPSISVVANQTGSVQQKLSFFLPVSTTTGGAVVTTNQQVDSTLQMSVTPIVAGDGSIFMTVTLQNDVPTISGNNTTINSRNIRTQILLENGDTAVIGGVFTTNFSKSRAGIPFLMDIPILGFFASSRTITDVRGEVLVFLNARILNAEESFKRNI